MKRSLLLVGAGLLAVIFCCLARAPLRSVVIAQTVRLPDQTSFHIVELMEREGSNGKWIEIYCHGDQGEPRMNILASTTKYSAGMSPLSPHSFVIHIPVEKFPRFLSALEIPVAFNGKTGVTSGKIDLRMWTSVRSRAIPAGVVD